MSDTEALKQHLHFQEREGDFHPFSSLMAALRDAREATRRQLVDGNKMAGEPHGSWLGALGYFTFLDQVGTCFAIKNQSSDKLVGVRAALSRFTDLDEVARNALFALRCSFAHDFSLFNVHPRKPELTHRFTVVADSDSQLVRLAERQWNGDISVQKPEVFTVVNLEAFGDLAECIYIKLVGLGDRSELKIVLAGGAKELVEKYSYAIFKYK